MTAKQALREWVETMSEEDARDLLDRLEWESKEFDVSPTPEEQALLEESRAAVAEGDMVEANALFKELGL